MDELDSIDRQIIVLVTKGFTSSYSIWSAMKNEVAKGNMKGPVLAYKNILQRSINLLKAGYLEEIKLELINLHGRRDYKATSNGMVQTIPYVIKYPDDFKNMIDYMDKIKLDKAPFINGCFNLAGASVHVLNSINKYTNEKIDVINKGGVIVSMKHTVRLRK